MLYDEGHNCKCQINHGKSFETTALSRDFQTRSSSGFCVRLVTHISRNLLFERNQANVGKRMFYILNLKRPCGTEVMNFH